MRSASAQRVVLCKVAFFRRGCLADPLAPLCVQPEFCTLLTRHGTYPFFVHFCGLHMALVAVLCTRTAAVFSVWGMPLRLGSMLFLRINARAAPNIFLVHPSVFFMISSARRRTPSHHPDDCCIALSFLITFLSLSGCRGSFRGNFR